MAGNFDLSGSLYNYTGTMGRYSAFYTETCSRQGFAASRVIGIEALRANIVYKEVLTTKFIEGFERHVERWVTFDHANVARCYGYALECGPMPATVMGCYPQGNIMQYVQAKHLALEERIKMVRDVAEGLGYLHALRRPIVHGDLRAANISVSKTVRAVIADYELAYIVPSNGYTGHVFGENTPWSAPEFPYQHNPTHGCQRCLCVCNGDNHKWHSLCV